MMRHISLSLLSLYAPAILSTQLVLGLTNMKNIPLLVLKIIISLENLLGIHHRIDVFWCENSGMCSTIIISFTLQLIVHCKIILVP